MEQFVDLLQEFVFNLLVLALPVVAGLVIALLRAWVKKALADVERAKPELFWVLEQAVDIAVRAAEQMELAGFIDDKKQYALDVAQSYLDSEGWDEVDVDILEAAIEAEVLKQFPK